MNFHFLFPLLGLASGIVISGEYHTGFIFATGSMGLALLFWLLLHIISKDSTKGRKLAFLHNFWIYFLFAGIGALDFEVRETSYVSGFSEKTPYQFTGRITDVKYQTDGDRFQVKINEIKNEDGAPIDFKNVKILLKTDGYVGSKGDVITFSTKVKSISTEKDQNPYLKNLYHQGISHTANIKFEKIKKSGDAKGFSSWIDRIHDTLVVLIENSKINRDTGDFLISILLGDKTYLSSEARDTLSGAGMAHILALSGMHVAIIYTIILILLFPLALTGHRKTRKLVALAFIWFYVLITGVSPSTTRAALMLTFVVAAYILERKNSAMNSLMASVFIILLIDPLAIWNVGLQLSFFCVASILIFIDKLNPIDRHVHPFTYKISNLILISIITGVCTAMLVAYYFGKIPLLFLPGNVILLPFLPLFVFLGIMYITGLFFGLDMYPIAKGIEGYLNIYLKTADFLSNSGESVIHITVSSVALVMWIIGIILIGMLIHIKRRKIILLSSAVACLLISFSGSVNSINRNQDTIRFKHSFTGMEVYATIDGVGKSYSFPRQNISSVTTDKYHILAIDQVIKESSLNKILYGIKDLSSYLMVGADADLKQIVHLIKTGTFKKIILHAGVGGKRKEVLMQMLDEEYWEKIHSLREEGGLELLLI